LQQAQRMQQQNRLTDQQMSDCQACQSQAMSDLQKLCQSLSKLGAQREARQRLLSMCEKLGQCQGFLCNGQAQSLGQCLTPGASPGGKKAGVGSVESRRDPIADLMGGGELTSLQGQKGAGPSETMTESAESGDGVASRRGATQRREYAKQMESFVQREDVPPAVREGVKRYFEGIHEAAEISEQ
ncbi:MAG: hypothetical protein AAF357_06150, partial [Verrucomicrobiota bacterium]